MEPRKKLSDVLRDRDQFLTAWKTTRPAAEAGLLPPGWYVAAVEKGELFAAKTGTPGYKLTFKVGEPAEYAGRLFWHDFWLTPAALPNALRDLAKLGITDPDQLERPLPAGIVVRVRLAVRKRDTGDEVNEVRELHLHDVAPPGDGPSAVTSPTSPPPPPAAADPAPWAVDLERFDEPPKREPKGDDSWPPVRPDAAEGGAG